MTRERPQGRSLCLRSLPAAALAVWARASHPAYHVCQGILCFWPESLRWDSAGPPQFGVSRLSDCGGGELLASLSALYLSPRRHPVVTTGGQAAPVSESSQNETVTAIQEEPLMTSWTMWEIWWSRIWGEGEGLSHRDEEEVAHEPARLPAELIAQGRGSKSYPPRPRG